MIRENNITMEYELDGEKILLTTNENGITNKIKNHMGIVSWDYNEEGNMINIIVNNKRFDKIIKNIEITETNRSTYLPYNIKTKGKFIGYTMRLDNLGLTVTLDSNDKITKIQGEDYEYTYKYNEQINLYEFVMDDVLITNKFKFERTARYILITVLEALKVIKNKKYLKDTKQNLNNFTFNNKPDMKGNVIPKDSHIGRLSKELQELYLDYEFRKEDYFAFNNKPDMKRNVMPKDSHLGRLSQLSYNQLLPIDKNYIYGIKSNEKDDYKMETNKSKIELEEQILGNIKKYKNEILKDFHKSKYNPDEWNFNKEESKENKKTMLSDIFKLERVVEVIKSIEDFSNGLSVDEIKEIALIGGDDFHKYGKNNFDIGIFTREYLEYMIISKNININVLLNKEKDCIVKYNEILNEKKTISCINFNLNNKYAFLVDDIDNKIITLLLYIPSHFPITHSDDVARIIKEYGLE